MCFEIFVKFVCESPSSPGCFPVKIVRVATSTEPRVADRRSLEGVGAGLRRLSSAAPHPSSSLSPGSLLVQLGDV